MTYVSANRRPNAAALAGAFGIPGAFGALLVVGLAVTVTTVPPRPNPSATPIAEVPLPPPPPPTPTPETPRDAKTTTTTETIPTPMPPNPLPVDLGRGEPVNTFPTGGETLTTGPVDFGIPGPTPSAASLYDPVGASPKGNPGKWVSNDDYRPRWIAEELSGTARFTLQIDARGKVTGCTITRSTGHPALDTATCDLVSKRARFDAARDGNGKPVPGSWSNSVTWRIPE
ncbi:MAG: energy transducer TonB [Erythrobacter sp.]|uniref:energy transducer TonB n=1 Tax=Erythrobacter sp. TaxID=1042 RepID=UPI0025F6E659|nr:TonB family protein [Erythrobacter sp.]MCL9998274.1 energy transducer TonB [Erythrobacter sp.]